MNSKNITISLLEDSDIDEINSFYNFSYKAHRSREQFLWEFYNAPAGKAIYVIARDVDSQKIVGTQCAIPIELSAENGTTILTAKSEDTLVNPDYRGLNIFENMYKLLFDKCRETGIKYIWGFTTAKKPFSKLGFTMPFDHSQSLMVFDILSSYKYISKLNPKNSTLSLFKIFVMCSLSKALSFKRFFISEKYLDSDFSHSQFGKTYINDNSRLISEASFKGFWIKQDLSFLTWRIVNNPYHEKIFNVYFSFKSDIVANLIFNHHKNGVWYLINNTYSSKLTVAQKVAINKKAIKLLLKSEEKSVKLIRTWEFSHNEIGLNDIEMRCKVGFMHLHRGMSLVWKCLDESEALTATDFILSRLATQGVI